MSDGEAEIRTYPPAAFRELRREVLLGFVRANPFGWLITVGPDGPSGCGVPFVAAESDGALQLRAHVARANPQSSHDGAAAMALFAGPHAYVRPTWYDLESMGGRAVPTWDYISVQAHGVLRREGPERLADQIRALSAQSEANFDDPWSPDDAPPDYMAALSRGIVAVTVAVSRLEGVWKLHQNHSEANRRGVIEGLSRIGDPAGVEIARAVAKGRPG